MNKTSLIDSLNQLQLIELDACTGCSECLNWCPVFEALEDKSISPPQKISSYRNLVNQLHGLRAKLTGGKIDAVELQRLNDALYQCTTCGVCGEVCEVGIWTQELWPALRAKMVDLGVGPIGAQQESQATVQCYHNPYSQPPEMRNAWLPDGVKIEQRAEVGYYVGCSGAYVANPLVIGGVKMLKALGIPFTMLDAEEEQCCGFPLYIIGQNEIVADLIKHNVDAYVARGVTTLVVSCPCCTNMLKNHWPRLYPGEFPLKIVHIMELAAPALISGKLRLRPLNEVVTYHDPCYLSRAKGVGIIEEPRQILQAIPGLRLVEFSRNRELSKCCGAGGGIRRAYPELSFDIALSIVKEAEAMGAERMVISCPACYERFPLAIKTRNYTTNLKICDIMEFVTDLLE